MKNVCVDTVKNVTMMIQRFLNVITATVAMLLSNCGPARADSYAISDTSYCYFYASDDVLKEIETEIVSQRFTVAANKAATAKIEAKIEVISRLGIEKDRENEIASLNYSVRISAAAAAVEKLLLDRISLYVKSRLMGFSREYSETLIGESQNGDGAANAEVRSIKDRYRHVVTGFLRKLDSDGQGGAVYELRENDVKWEYRIYFDKNGDPDFIVERRLKASGTG